jgi:Ca-activated chloride channel family protein
MAFAHPYFLLLLLLLPLLAWLKGKRGRSPAFLYSSLRLVEGLTRARRSRAGGFLLTLRWLILALFIVALAQPRLTKSETTVKASGVDIAVALDLSGSMEMPDFVVNNQRIDRLDMAKIVLSQFIDMRPNDRIGLVAFGGRAYIASPLTLDHDFLQENVARLRLHLIEDNTALGSGLATAVNRLRDLKSKSKIVILMTDGANNAGNIAPLDAANAARTLGVKVYTVGVGNDEVARQMRRPDLLPDEDTLRKIADTTGGKYYRADNAERFRQIYAEIDKLEKTEAVVSKYTEFKELFPWFVAGGLALLLIEIVLGQTVFRRLP